MTSHLGMMGLFAACLATVFATIMRDDARAAVRLGARIFGGLVVTAYALGWIMYIAFR